MDYIGLPINFVIFVFTWDILMNNILILGMNIKIIFDYCMIYKYLNWYHDITIMTQ